MAYVWQHDTWPHFTWDIERILPMLSTARRRQGFINAQAEHFDLRDQAELLLQETSATSEIEGQKLDKAALRSSIARRLGLPTAGLPSTQKHSDALVEVVLDATRNFGNRLTRERLWGWQSALFPGGYSGIRRIRVGGFREDDAPMRVISGTMGREITHFEAPPASQVDHEMTVFLDWWNDHADETDGVIRAAVAHFWFVTIHPFEDGNGRIARAITDMAMAQDERSAKRMYSLSSRILAVRKSYYTILEETQKRNGEITEWIIWFLDCFLHSMEESDRLITKSVSIGNFYRNTTDIPLNQRQIKVLKKLLERLPDDFGGGLTNRKYVAMTNTSPETAKRDLKDMVLHGLLIQNPGGGRSTSYRLNRALLE
jgi:Fic family protein